MAELQGDPLGERVRCLREARGLSLRALAEQSALSVNAISRIERGDSSPTVTTLRRLAQALEVPIGSLFESQEASTVILMRRERRLRSERSGVTLEGLGAGLPGQRLEPYLMTLQPGASSLAHPVSHPGEEFLLCLQGNVSCLVGDQWHELATGDSLLFRANQAHLCRNSGEGFATLFLMLENLTESPHLRELHLNF